MLIFLRESLKTSNKNKERRRQSPRHLRQLLHEEQIVVMSLRTFLKPRPKLELVAEAEERVLQEAHLVLIPQVVQDWEIWTGFETTRNFSSFVRLSSNNRKCLSRSYSKLVLGTRNSLS